MKKSILFFSLLSIVCSCTKQTLDTEPLSPIESRPSGSFLQCEASQVTTCAYQWVSYAGTVKYQSYSSTRGHKASIYFHANAENFTVTNNLGNTYTVTFFYNTVLQTAVPFTGVRVFDLVIKLNLSPHDNSTLCSASTIELTVTVTSDLQTSATLTSVLFGCN